MNELCPSSLNQLGKGIFSCEREARLLADDFVFAAKVPGTLVGTLVICKRSITDAVTDANLDSPRFRESRITTIP